MQSNRNRKNFLDEYTRRWQWEVPISMKDPKSFFVFAFLFGRKTNNKLLR